MANEIENEIVKRAYDNAMLHPAQTSPLLFWAFIFIVLVILLLALSSMYFVAKRFTKM